MTRPFLDSLSFWRLQMFFAVYKFFCKRCQLSRLYFSLVSSFNDFDESQIDLFLHLSHRWWSMSWRYYFKCYIPVTCGDNDFGEDASQAFFLSFDFSFGAILVVKSTLICISFYSPRFTLEYFTCIHKLCSFLWFRAFI